MNEGLKPCPICGSKLDLSFCDEGCCTNVREAYCLNESCGFILYIDEPLPKAIEMANRRTADEWVRELVDAIRKLLKALGAWREHDWEHWHESIEDPIGDVEDILRKHGKGPA